MFNSQKSLQIPKYNYTKVLKNRKPKINFKRSILFCSVKLSDVKIKPCKVITPFQSLKITTTITIINVSYNQCSMNNLKKAM